VVGTLFWFAPVLISFYSRVALNRTWPLSPSRARILSLSHVGPLFRALCMASSRREGPTWGPNTLSGLLVYLLFAAGYDVTPPKVVSLQPAEALPTFRCTLNNIGGGCGGMRRGAVWSCGFGPTYRSARNVDRTPAGSDQRIELQGM
jgi:hypothetical protein